MCQVSIVLEGQISAGTPGRHARIQGYHWDWWWFTMLSPLVSLDLHSAQLKPRREHNGTDRELKKRKPLTRESRGNPWPFLSPSALWPQAISWQGWQQRQRWLIMENCSGSRELSSPFSGAMGWGEQTLLLLLPLCPPSTVVQSQKWVVYGCRTAKDGPFPRSQTEPKRWQEGKI